MWVVEIGPIEGWLRSLSDDDYDLVIAALLVLRSEGPSLGRPLVDGVKSSRHKNMKELRPGSKGRTEYRLLFAFDSARQAIVLVAGDKRGSWEKWYRTNVPLADTLFDEHLAALNSERKTTDGKNPR